MPPGGSIAGLHTGVGYLGVLAPRKQVSGFCGPSIHDAQEFTWQMDGGIEGVRKIDGQRGEVGINPGI